MINLNHNKLLIFLALFLFFWISEILSITDLPEPLKNKKPVDLKEIEKKKEGSYFTGLGVPASNPDLGLLGVFFLSYYINGYPDNPYYYYTPYLHQISAVTIHSTKGLHLYGVVWKAPYFMQTSNKIYMNLNYSKNITAQYFGIGEKTMNNLKAPSGKTFSTYKEYFTEIKDIENGYTDSYYNNYIDERVDYDVAVYRDIKNSGFKISYGVLISKFWIYDYTDMKVPAYNNANEDDIKDAINNKTLLREEYEMGLINGYKGGWDNSLKIGIAYDTRDLEPNPRRGQYHDINLKLSNPAWGSDFNYYELTSAVRFYYSPIPQIADFIVAIRGVYSVKSGNIPFFTMDRITFSGRSIEGLGGTNTLRGYLEPRFVAPVMNFYNFEMRYIFHHFHAWNQYFELMLVPFFDIGRVFNDVNNTTLKNYKYSYGAGFRIGWNQSTIIAMNLGFCDEGTGFYVNADHIF